MAKVSYVSLLPAQEELYFAGLRPGDRFTYSRIAKKTTLFSVKRKKGLTQRSLLPQVASAWNALTALQKGAWASAGSQCGLNGYRLFVKDKCARIKNDLPGNATPSLFHQAFVGAIHIEAPATSIKIAQYHPRNYYVYHKIAGTKAQYEAQLVTEDIALPFTLSLNYKSNLTSTGDGAFAKVYAKFWYSYQGVNLYRDLELNLDLSTDWVSITDSLASLATIVIGYDLYIELYNVQGDLYFDNIKAEHSGQNWARDTYCNDINQGFTNVWYQIPKHWVAVSLPAGADYESIYPT